MEAGPRSTCVRHSHACRVVKGEDAYIASGPLLDAVEQSWLWAVCDGHIGRDAARFVTANLQPMLAARLQWVTQVPEETDLAGLGAFATLVRRAVCETFAALDNALYEHLILAPAADIEAKPPHSPAPRQASGTSLTVALVLGPLLTVANIGDCHAVLDTGCFRMQLTHSHRLADSDTELRRVKEAGCHVASLGFDCRSPATAAEHGIGPLRLWPGGLCLSRGIGDYDSGPHVLPLPHVKQVILPEDGCRLVLASDGLWDVLTFQRALALIRNLPIWTTAAELVRIASKNQRVIDDTSVLVVDVLPHSGTSFRLLAARKRSERGERLSSSGASGRSDGRGGGAFGGLFSCFGAPPSPPPPPPRRYAPVAQEEGAVDPEEAGLLPYVLHDADSLAEHPDLRAQLLRNTHVSRLGDPSGRWSLPPSKLSLEASGALGTPPPEAPLVSCIMEAAAKGPHGAQLAHGERLAHAPAAKQEEVVFAHSMGSTDVASSGDMDDEQYAHLHGGELSPARARRGAITAAAAAAAAAL